MRPLNSLKRYSVGLSMGVCGGRNITFTGSYFYIACNSSLRWKKEVYTIRNFFIWGLRLVIALPMFMTV
jgi:hypothetical protein